MGADLFFPGHKISQVVFCRSHLGGEPVLCNLFARKQAPTVIVLILWGPH